MDWMLSLLANCFVLLLLTTTDCFAVTCFQCTNVEIADDSSSAVKNLFSGKNDPSCGSYPSTSNAESCDQGFICGSVTSDITGDVPVIGRFHAKLQMRSCVEGTVGALSQCKKPDQKTSEEVSGVVTALAKWDLIDNFDVKGQSCSCGTDFCVPDCDAGLQISGLCIKFWMIGVAAAGIIVFLILFGAICCCCCGCCCKRNSGVTTVYIAANPYSRLSEEIGFQDELQAARSNPSTNQIR